MWVWTWWRNRRRKRLLDQPFPQDWEIWLRHDFRHFPRLTAVEQNRLRRDVRLLVAEKHWEGCNGLVVTDEMRITIAAHAALLGLGFDDVPFERLLSVLIYPDTFVSRQVRRAKWGGVEEADEPRLGEAWYQGPVLLSWREVQEQCVATDSGRNVVIHEFAHLLDMQNHEVDGIPALDRHIHPEKWVATFHVEYERLIRQARFGRRTVLDYYGATSEAEFFAVASEAFFERATQLREESPELYAILHQFYRQDPASRATAHV
jgi:Mlc titration factor MtfA (ptsG expression regulator)